MAKNVLVPIADATEEIEAVCIIDTLHRAGVTVTVASVGKPQITASRGTRIVADTTIDTCAGQSYDMIAVPGGMPGAQTLAQSKVLVDLLMNQAQAGRWIAAICAAPAVVLQVHGLLEGIRATCHPAFHKQIPPAFLSKDPVVVDGHTITAQGAGVAIEFSLTLVEHLVGRERGRKWLWPWSYQVSDSDTSLVNCPSTNRGQVLQRMQEG